MNDEMHHMRKRLHSSPVPMSRSQVSDGVDALKKNVPRTTTHSRKLLVAMGVTVIFSVVWLGAMHKSMATMRGGHRRIKHTHPPAPLSSFSMLLSPSSAQIQKEAPLLIPHKRGLFSHHNRDLPTIETFLAPDYGNLIIPSLRISSTFERSIHQHDDDMYELYRTQLLNATKDESSYYDPYEDRDLTRDCIRPKSTYNIFPICNSFHEGVTLDRVPNMHVSQDFQIRFLESGAFKDAYMFTPLDGSSTPHDIVVKTPRMPNEVDRVQLHHANTEALIMGELHGSPVSGRIYGHCGLSFYVEKGIELYEDIVPTRKHYRTGRIPQSELDELQKDDVAPLNKLTNEEKLNIAIAMAESLANIHGFPSGPVVNDDISLYQWLRSEDGRVILNDYNMAEFQEWNAKKKSWCKYYTRFDGSFKPPEEYKGGYVDTSADVWPMGNLIFALLTGLKPYYTESEESKIMQMTQEAPPYLDPRYKTRSFIEGRLVLIMEKCHKMEPSARVDIFEVVRYLRETKQLAPQYKGVTNLKQLFEESSPNATIAK